MSTTALVNKYVQLFHSIPILYCILTFLISLIFLYYFNDVCDVINCHYSLHQVVEDGGEGVILRKPNSLYEFGRSSSLLKLKVFCFVLFCFVLFCFVLFCFVLFCFVLFCFVLFCFVLFSSLINL